MSRYGVLLTRRPATNSIPLIKKVMEVNKKGLRDGVQRVKWNDLPSMLIKADTKKQAIAFCVRCQGTGGAFQVVPLRKDLKNYYTEKSNDT
jgi:hypothetical protein